MKAQAGKGFGRGKADKWERCPAGSLALLLNVLPHHRSLGKSQPQPASSLCQPPALPTQQLLAGTFPPEHLVLGSSSTRLGLWLCPLPLVPTSASWMPGLFPWPFGTSLRPPLPSAVSAFCIPTPTWVFLIAIFFPQTSVKATQTQSSYFLIQRTLSEDKLVPVEATDPCLISGDRH